MKEKLVTQQDIYNPLSIQGLHLFLNENGKTNGIYKVTDEGDIPLLIVNPTDKLLNNILYDKDDNKIIERISINDETFTYFKQDYSVLVLSENIVSLDIDDQTVLSFIKYPDNSNSVNIFSPDSSDFILKYIHSNGTEGMYIYNGGLPIINSESNSMYGYTELNGKDSFNINVNNVNFIELGESIFEKSEILIRNRGNELLYSFYDAENNISDTILRDPSSGSDVFKYSVFENGINQIGRLDINNVFGDGILQTTINTDYKLTLLRNQGTDVLESYFNFNDDLGALYIRNGYGSDFIYSYNTSTYGNSQIFSPYYNHTIISIDEDISEYQMVVLAAGNDVIYMSGDYNGYQLTIYGNSIGMKLYLLDLDTNITGINKIPIIDINNNLFYATKSQIQAWLAS